MEESYTTLRAKLPPGIVLDENVYVKMRDGIKLAVDVYRPEAEGRYPALQSMAPYMKEIQQQVSSKRVDIELTEHARNWLARNGFSPEYGARPLARMIQVEIKDVLSTEILFGNLLKGGSVTIDVAPEAGDVKPGEEEKRHLVFSYC